MSHRLKLTEWETLTEHLRRFGQTGVVTIDDGRIHIDFGAAEIEISQDGKVKTGMPLHDFTRDDAVEVVVDHDSGTLTVESDTVSYTFRRPGG